MYVFGLSPQEDSIQNQTQDLVALREHCQTVQYHAVLLSCVELALCSLIIYLC